MGPVRAQWAVGPSRGGAGDGLSKSKTVYGAEGGRLGSSGAEWGRVGLGGFSSTCPLEQCKHVDLADVL